MIESYVLFGRYTYQDSNEKTVSLLKKAFILSEGSVQDYYKSIERLVHYEKKNDFCSTSKSIFKVITEIFLQFDLLFLQYVLFVTPL